MAGERTRDEPPMEPSNEATAAQLRLAKEEGDRYRKALERMIKDEAHGDLKQAGDYLVAYAVEEAEGMYEFHDGSLMWHEPHEENIHIEVAVLDGADGRFIPGLTVQVTVVGPKGQKVGTHTQPFMWHPWLYHYGRNWKVPGDGTYSLQIHIEPAGFMRHDKQNGQRFQEAVDVTFEKVVMETGQKKS